MTSSAASTHAGNRSAALTVVGAGGNIGSFLLPHLARDPAVGRITLIDPDEYEEKNIAGQDITAADIGRSKVKVRRERLLDINPELAIIAIADTAQSVPPGRLKADVILSALDSRRARLEVGRIAWCLNTPFLDAGVHTQESLVRIDLYIPSPDAACVECGMSRQAYAALEQVYPCRGAASVAPTNGTSSLGALAASLLAIECSKLLSGRLDTSLAGRQLIIDLKHHTHFVTSFRRNPACRFNHEHWRLISAPSPAMLSIADVLTIADLGRDVHLRAIGHKFVHQVVCSTCGWLRKDLHLTGRSRRRRCSCGDRMSAAGFHMSDTLDCARAATGLSRRLDRLGFIDGDVVAVESETSVRHLQLGGC